MTDPARYLETTTAHRARFFTQAVEDFFAGYVVNDRTLQQKARRKLEIATTETLAIGEVIGATTVLRDVAAKGHEAGLFGADRGVTARFAATPLEAVIPNVTFDEAIENMVSRTPKTIRRAAERSAQTISKLYSGGNAVAFARSAEASVTRHARDFIAQALKDGLTEGEAGRRLAMSVNEVRKRSRKWSEAYARNVFRTNINTAITAGRFRQAQDEIVRAVTPAFRFDAVGDSDTRPNHRAADGVILSVSNQAWRFLAPPLGYMCRCQVSLVSQPMLEALGRWRNGAVVDSAVPAAAKPDDGFRSGARPDLLLNEVVR